MLKTGEWIRVYDIPAIMRNPDAISAFNFYQRWKKMGMPFGSWGYNPNIFAEVVDLLEPLDRFYHPEFKI